MVRIVVKQDIGVAGAAAKVQEELQMQLLVKLPCGTTLAPMVQYRDTVFFVKAKIQDMMKIAPDMLRLLFQGRQLQDEQMLCAYNIQRGDSVTAMYLLLGGMQAPSGAHILPPIPQTRQGFQNEDEAMLEVHTPPVGVLVEHLENVVSASDSSVSVLRLAWTHSQNERLQLISQNIPQMEVEWHTMDPSREEPHVQMTPEAYDHYEQEIVGALVATGEETRQVALFDRESIEPIPRTLHEEAIGALGCRV